MFKLSPFKFVSKDSTYITMSLYKMTLLPMTERLACFVIFNKKQKRLFGKSKENLTGFAHESGGTVFFRRS